MTLESLFLEPTQIMLGTQLTPDAYLRRCAEVFETIHLPHVEELADDIYAAYETGRFVFLCGNGGSGSNASHFCEDLGKSTLDRKDFTNDSKKRLKVLSLTDNTPYILAWGNDEGFDRVFVEQLKNFASPGDVLIAISGSGNSPNILERRRMGQPHRADTLGITGFSGGKLQELGQEEPARPPRRHGHGRIHPPRRLPLDPQRHPRPHQQSGTLRRSQALGVGDSALENESFRRPTPDI